MQPLNAAQRRSLKSKAQLLEPCLKVGQQGVGEPFLKSVETELARHGLIKIRFVHFQEEKKALCEKIAAATESAHLQTVGHVAIFYRPIEPKS